MEKKKSMNNRKKNNARKKDINYKKMYIYTEKKTR